MQITKTELLTTIESNVIHIDAAHPADDVAESRIRRALANFKGLVIENAVMDIHDKDPDNIQITITGNKVKINNE